MHPRETAGGVIVNTEGKIALVWQNGNSWSFPKGGIDEGETPLQAAYREIYEEVGLGADALSYVTELGSYVRRFISMDGRGENMDTPPSRRTLFLFTTSADTLSPQDAEVSKANFVSTDEALHLLTHPKDKEFLQSVRPIIEKAARTVEGSKVK